MPTITLWYIQASRSNRIAWLRKELCLNYCFRKKQAMKAPKTFKGSHGNPLVKAPML
ncbi:uncharacterized protein BDR25DRAFT_235191 [Lindgomyces ingoldianus]|uniref:Uncharacterized protein n=1 Tax=Lindgomyces ingoldianus TaxID=673940 RepID=A0ACB6QM39_9PLEO|nr:uncharacterized protein BDR25DRAFT_235191 [Lindgomyces ingoldianus]KAF2467180.1 hypothetical protein BDR25DRAFT_235191 [Lindgomyces ingoldianus]